MNYLSTLLLLLGSCCSAFSQLANGKCKFLGNIIKQATPSDFTLYWNQVTPENAGKWGSVEANRDQMNWNALDNAYRTAKEAGLPFKQHTFVWGQQLPEWVTTLSSTQQKHEVDEWIRLFCERYPDTDFIDVVNEPLHAPPPFIQALGGAGASGWDWIILCFETARRYCPGARLFLNDYGIISNNTATTETIKIIRVLKERNLIDGFGEQGHFLETTPLQTLQSNLDRIGAELPVHISELDVNIADDVAQRERYQELFPALWNHAAVEGITLWGYRQGETWRENAYLLRSNGIARPAFSWLKEYMAATDVSCIPVAIDGIALNSPEIYPNPAPGVFSIRIPSEHALEIVDNTGARVLPPETIPAGIHSFEANIPPGMYFLKLSSTNRIWIQKIIIY